MAHSNISIFVPHAGCPHMCSFCNQKTISGAQDMPHAEDVKKICTQALNEVRDLSNSEIAFFGGSFTAIERGYMIELLEAAHSFVGEGKFKGIRISTRPDCIDAEILDILRGYGVTAIELGAQSMCNHVLEANERGHTAEDVIKASRLIRCYGFELGLQMMVGLYKSACEDEAATWGKIVDLRPDTVRIYPVVILENTRLGELYKSGEYLPFEFETVVDLCAGFLTDAHNCSIDVIKMGLHASEIVEGQALGGFYHPAFRELCEGRNYRLNIEASLSGERTKITEAVICVPARDLSKALGHKKCNIKYFEQKGITLKIIPDNDLTYMKIISITNGGE